MKKIKSIAAFALLVGSASPGHCWDRAGHMVIAQIAYDRLSPAAKQAVDSRITLFESDPLVAGLPDKYKPYNAVTVAAFMDDLRDETKIYNTWHYVDLPDDADKKTVLEKFDSEDDPNVYEAIVDKCEKTLKDPASKPADSARMLAFLFHFAGDIHQPLHAIGRQKGGNDYHIEELPGADPNWTIKNLHSFWDNAYRYDVVDGKIAVTYNKLDLPRTMHPDDPDLKAFADKIVSEAGDNVKDQSKDIDPVDWALESHDIAVKFAFPAGDPKSLSPDYVKHARKIAFERMALAGERLATLLNTIFSTPDEMKGVNFNGGDNAAPIVEDAAFKGGAYPVISANDPAVKSALDAHALDAARAKVGSKGAFVGTVSDLYATAGGKVTILDFDPNFRTALTAVLTRNYMPIFPNMMSLKGRKVLVRGIFSDYKGKIQIELTQPGQIAVVK